MLLIFFNLDFSGKKTGISAYSVFNKNYEKIAGTFTPDDLLNEMNIRKIDNPTSATTNPNLFDLAKEEKFKDPHSKCECGSNKKFKNCSTGDWTLIYGTTITFFQISYNPNRLLSGNRTAAGFLFSSKTKNGFQTKVGDLSFYSYNGIRTIACLFKL
eukprot:gene3665-6480_t